MITAKQFRDAAEDVYQYNAAQLVRLLLTAADQREQLDEAQEMVVALVGREQHALAESDNRLALLQTVTEEVNSLREQMLPTPHCRFPYGCDIHASPEACAKFWRDRLAKWKQERPAVFNGQLEP